MSKGHAASFLAVVALAAWSGFAGAAEVVVLDGATLRYDGRTVRIWGIKVPRKSETCRTSRGMEWSCGETAFQQLSAVSADEAFTCENKEPGFVICKVASVDVGLLMVKEGLAYALQDYEDVEIHAREARVGLWE